METTEESEIGVAIVYMVHGPGWHPVYDIRVSSDTKAMNLTYNAMVSQNTLEDWNGVDLKLSTAQPRISGMQPELHPWYIDKYRAPLNSYPTMGSLE